MEIGTGSAPREGGNTDPFSKDFRARLILPVIVALVACYLMYLGNQLGELGKIFEKATMVCLQCIGIG